MIKFIQKYLSHTVEATSLLQLSLPFTVWIGYTWNVGWIWWALCVFSSMFIYVMIGNNVAMHRYFTHKHFTVSKPVELFFLWIGSMLGFGGPLSYAMTHIVHHKYPDTEYDPHGPARGKRAWLVYFQKVVDVTETPIFNRNIVELNKKYRWLHNYYVVFVLANAAILWLIDPRVFLFLWAIPASAGCWIVTMSIWRQHIGLKPQNSPIANYDIMYEGLHANHHDWPMAPNTAIHPGEIDWTYQLSRIFRPKYNWTGQPPKQP